MTYKNLLDEQLDPKDFRAEINSLKARLDQIGQEFETDKKEKDVSEKEKIELKKALDKLTAAQQKKGPQFEKQGIGTTRKIAAQQKKGPQFEKQGIGTTRKIVEPPMKTVNAKRY